MMRRLPSMENGQASFGDFAAAMSPHPTHQHHHHHQQQFVHHPQPQPQLHDHHFNHYNQHNYFHPPYASTPNSHNGYPTGAVADPTTPTAASAAATAYHYQPPSHGTPSRHHGYPTSTTPTAAAAATATAYHYQPPNPGTPSRHHGYPTSTTPTAAAAANATAILPNTNASIFSFSNIDAPVSASGNFVGNNASANASGFGRGYNGYHGHHGDAEAWLQSPAATLLIQRCVTAHKWDEYLARRVLVEYTRFCHLKIRMGDANDQNMVAPSLVHQVWQSHYLDSIRYMEDIQSICGRGAYLHFNHYDNTGHETKPRRIQSTETALVAMFGNGGVDRDIWTYYTDASTITAAAAAQTIASRAPTGRPTTIGANANDAGVGGGVGCGANTRTTPTSIASKHGTPSSFTSKHGGASTSPSSATRRPPSVLRSSNRTSNTPLSTVSENAVSFKDQIKEKVRDEDAEKIAEENDDDDDDDDNGAYNDEDSIKTEEVSSDEENHPEPVTKKRKSATPKSSARTRPTQSLSKAKTTSPKVSSVGKPKTPASSSRKKTSVSKADSSDVHSVGTGSVETNVLITNISGDSKSYCIGPTTTALSLRDAYIRAMDVTDDIPDTLKLYHNGILLPNETVLRTLVPPLGEQLELKLLPDISPIKIDMFDGTIMEI